jgi:ABC-2 type transport system permease protein
MNVTVADKSAAKSSRADRHGSMIFTVARKEFTEIMRDGRFLWTCLIIAVLLLTSFAVGASRYSQERALRSAAAAETREQWLDQGKKGPHSAAHYGMYAFKPATPLALFDPGVNDYTGTITFLEAHRENQASYKPAQDGTALQRFGDLSGAMILQLLIPLLIILLCFGMVSGEREEGTLRQLLSVGARRTDLITGKALGVAATLGVALIPAALIGAAIAAMRIEVGDEHELIDLPSKIAVLTLAYLVYFGIFVAVSLAVSIAARSSRAALMGLLAFWIVNGLLLPRAAADISRLLFPTPSALELAKAIAVGRDRGPHPHEPSHPNHQAFVKKVLEKYGVSKIEELPVSFIGLALQADEENGYKVFEREYGNVWNRYEQQDRVQQVFGILSPQIAMRAVSTALSGTDIAFYRDFAAASETYRRGLIKLMNDDLIKNTAGMSVHEAEWDYKGDKNLWSRVPPFDYDPPEIGEILGKNVLPMAILAVWLSGGVALLVYFTRRMRAD